MSQYTINDSNCFNNTNSFNILNICAIVDDRAQLLTWLSPLEPRSRHRDVQERRVDNVGNGSYKLRNLGASVIAVGKVKAIRQPYPYKQMGRAVLVPSWTPSTTLDYRKAKLANDTDTGTQIS